MSFDVIHTAHSTAQDTALAQAVTFAFAGDFSVHTLAESLQPLLKCDHDGALHALVVATAASQYIYRPQIVADLIASTGLSRTDVNEAIDHYRHRAEIVSAQAFTVTEAARIISSVEDDVVDNFIERHIAEGRFSPAARTMGLRSVIADYNEANALTPDDGDYLVYPLGPRY